MTRHPNAYFDRLIVVDGVEEIQPRVVSQVNGFNSVAVVCSKCGTVWAKVLTFTKGLDNPEPELCSFTTKLGVCRECGGAGSLFDLGLINPRYPRIGVEVYRRELELEIERLTKERSKQ